LCQDGVYLPCVLLLSLSDVCVVLCLLGKLESPTVS